MCLHFPKCFNLYTCDLEREACVYLKICDRVSVRTFSWADINSLMKIVVMYKCPKPRNNSNLVFNGHTDSS